MIRLSKKLLGLSKYNIGIFWVNKNGIVYWWKWKNYVE